LWVATSALVNDLDMMGESGFGNITLGDCCCLL